FGDESAPATAPGLGLPLPDSKSAQPDAPPTIVPADDDAASPFEDPASDLYFAAVAREPEMIATTAPAATGEASQEMRSLAVLAGVFAVLEGVRKRRVKETETPGRWRPGRFVY